MSSVRLDDLARRSGIVLSREGFGGPPLLSDDTKLRLLTALGVNTRREAMLGRRMKPIPAFEPGPQRAPDGVSCFLPDWLRDGRAWGISAQLYELRSHRNWGIGDFRDLADLCRIAASAGADFVGVNPLHALFLAEPTRCSPFSPSSRLLLNPLYIAVDTVAGYTSTASETAEAEALRAMPMVDYTRVAALKLAALRRIWKKHSGTIAIEPRFKEFRARCGDALERHALFEALSASFVKQGLGGGWQDWPPDFRRTDSASVKAFADANRDAVDFYAWLQWVADTQLTETRAVAHEAGMRIGLYLDFAVGEVPDGSAAWSDPEQTVSGVTIGAPPDMFTADGQEWGLTPLSPLAMTRSGFAAYRATIAALMGHSGALRIDHVMSLWQLFFVPEGRLPADGAFVRYPFEQMLRILAELSDASGTIVVGEDLGFVPPGFREVMQAVSILSYRILYFEKWDIEFTPAEAYPRLALACLSTHDLPTIKGWWRGDDIELRLRHALIDAELAARQRIDRASEREALLRRLEWSGLLTREEDKAVAWQSAWDPAKPLPEAVVVATHRLVGKTPSLLAAVRLADLAGEDLPTNLPGTIDAYPNWRLKSSKHLENLAEFGLFRAICKGMATERPRSA